MAGLKWFRVAAEASRDEKVLRLRMRLGDLADAYVWRLWCHCARSRPDGAFTGPEAGEVLEAAAEWRNAPGGLVAALLAVGLIDVREGGIHVHSWGVWQHAIAERARKDRERKREKPAGSTRSTSILAESVRKTTDSTPTPPPTPQEQEGEAIPVESLVECVRKRSEIVTKPAPSNAGFNQQRFWQWSQGERQAVLGHGTLPDEQWTQRQVTERLSFVSTLNPDVLTRAYTLFLEDPVKQAKALPCPMWMFVQEWPKYVGHVLQAQPTPPEETEGAF